MLRLLSLGLDDNAEVADEAEDDGVERAPRVVDQVAEAGILLLKELEDEAL